MRVDIGLGDVVTPPAVVHELPRVLEESAPPRVRVYPPETIVAEKLQAIVKLGMVNSRMKDYFDIHALAAVRVFDGMLLVKAVSRTFSRRRTPVPDSVPPGLQEEFFEDAAKVRQWRGFLKKTGLPDTDFTNVGRLLRVFLLPVLDASKSAGTVGEWRESAWH